MIHREEIIGDCRLILGDCRDILPTLGPVDCVITDPPYGINRDGQKRTAGGNGGRKAYDFLGWDGDRPPPRSADRPCRSRPGDSHVGR